MGENEAIDQKNDTLTSTLPRDTLSRIGIVLLNFLGPGLGLLRTLRWRDAVVLLLAPYVIFGIATAVAIAGPRAGPIGYITGFGMVVIALIAVYLIAMVASWRTSRFAPADRPIWSRWYAIVVAVIVLMLVQPILVAAGEHTYKVFSIPSEAMMPTLEVGDHVVVDMRLQHSVSMGDVVVFTAPSGYDYIKRVAAMPGDRIGLRGGIPFVNGQPARQRVVGTRKLAEPGQIVARVIEERLPGDTRLHHVLDSGYGMFDDYPEVVVPTGHIFVLGDHRDRSADSRASAKDGGSEMVPLAKVRGEAIFIRNGPREGSFGMRLDQ